MKFIGLCATVGLGLVGVSAIATTGCTSTTTVNNGDGGDLFPEDAADAATPEDTGTATPDTGTDGSNTVTTDGAMCSLGVDTGSAECDTCVEDNCCTSLVACDTPDSAGVDDAGRSSCEALVSCLNDVNSMPEAGLNIGDCTMSYTAQEQSNANALLSCIASSCATPCSAASP